MTLPTHDPSPDFPLRPLRVGEILRVGMVVARRNLAVLGAIAFVIAAISTGVLLAVLAGTGSLHVYADGSWLDDLMLGRTANVPNGILTASAASTLVTMIGTPLLAGLATVFAANLAMGRRSGRGSLGARMRGRWPTLLAVSVCFAVIVAVGLLLLVVPGVIAYLALAVAAPVAVMERSGVRASLRRSAAMTAGHRGRILGAVLLTSLVSTAASVIVTAMIGSAAGGMSATGLLVLTQVVSVIVSAVVGAWASAVIGVLYIDIRLRTEPLAQSLRAAAAADRAQQRPGPGPGPYPVAGTGQPPA